MTAETDIEQKLINKLHELKYSDRSDIARGVARIH